ncbi:MAG: SDR family oxidoreductase [Bacteroidia bacterium]|nr:SDR family oxidoreductase [Bacteroidia bacterium]
MTKFALITGGTKGIGKAVAQILAKAGYNLILTYGNDVEAAQFVQAEFTERFNTEIFILQADITSEKSIQVIFDFLKSKDIRLFSLIFNAGITSRTRFEDIKQEEWERVFYANVHFPVFLLQKILSRIEIGGNVLFTGSLMGVYPHSVSLSYGVTKSAVHALVQNFVKFMAPYKIRVNAIAPGFVDTDWQKTKPAEIRRNIENKIALERFCDPDELAEIYKLIVENNYLNGEIITVSGGYSYK